MNLLSTQSPPKNALSYIVVIGGGTVELDYSGNAFAKAPIVEYLHELAEIFGSVCFFAQVVPKSGRYFETPLDRNKIKLRHLRYRNANNPLTRVRLLIGDLWMLWKTMRKAAGVIEYHPAGGGWLLSVLQALVAKKSIVYLGADPKKRWATRSRERLVDKIKKLHFLVSAEVAVRLADFVLVRDMDQLKRLRRLKPGRVASSMPLSMAPPALFRRKETCQLEVITLLYVGKLEHAKGIEDLLGAMRYLVNDIAVRGKQVRLVLVGEEPLDGCGYKKVICDMAETFNISAQIQLTGYIDDMTILSRLYKQADIFVLPSHAEGFPRVIDEALSHGLPVITTNLPGITGALKEHEEVIFVEPKQPLQLSAAIREVITNQPLRRTLIEGGYAAAERRLRERASTQHARLLLTNKHTPTAQIAHKWL